MNNLKLHAVVGKFRQHFAQYFDRALHVGLDDERKLFDVTRFELLVQLIERDARARGLRESGLTQFALAELDDVARARFVRDLELIACIGSALQSENFHGSRWPRAPDRTPVIVKHGSNLAIYGAANKNVAGM